MIFFIQRWNFSGRKLTLFAVMLLFQPCFSAVKPELAVRERISLTDNWRFMKYASAHDADLLIYDIRPLVTDRSDSKAADSRPTGAVKVESSRQVLKPWILPSGNTFIKNPFWKAPANWWLPTTATLPTLQLSV